MGTTDNAAAGKQLPRHSRESGNDISPSPQGEGRGEGSVHGMNGLSGSVGIGGANAPDDVFQVSSALASNGLMDGPQDTADSTLFSGIISAQEQMDSALKRDGLVKPDGPTQQTFARLNDQGFVKAPASPAMSPDKGSVGTGDAATNAAITAQTKQQAVKTAEAKSLEHMGDVTRTGFQQNQDVQRVQKAKAEAQRATQRAQTLEIKRRETAQQDQLEAASKARAQAQQQASKQTKEIAQELGSRLGKTLKSVLSAPPQLPPRPKRDGQATNKDEGVERRSTKLPLSHEALQSNQRLAESLKKRAGVGDLPKFTTDAINTDGVKAVTEVADLIEQVRENDPEQAQELFDKTMQGIGNGERRSLEDFVWTSKFDPEKDHGRLENMPARLEDGEPEIMLMGAKDDAANGQQNPGPDAGSGSGENLRGVTMDENGRYYDKDGNRIENPDKNPKLKQAQFAPVAPVPGVMPPPPGTVQPATPQDVQKALDRAQGDLEKLANDPAFLKTPVGQAMIAQGVFKDLISEGDTRQRTDAAPRLPDREEFPAHEGDPNDGMLPGHAPAHDRVINPPPYEMPETGQFDIPPSEDKSDDIEKWTILEMGRKRDLKEMDAVADTLRIDRKSFGDKLHAIKGGEKGDVKIDTNTGNVYDKETNEWIGNVHDEN